MSGSPQPPGQPERPGEAVDHQCQHRHQHQPCQRVEQHIDCGALQRRPRLRHASSVLAVRHPARPAQPHPAAGIFGARRCRVFYLLLVLTVGTLLYFGLRTARAQSRPKTRVIGPDDDPEFL